MRNRIIISASALLFGIALGALGTMLWVAEFI